MDWRATRRWPARPLPRGQLTGKTREAPFKGRWLLPRPHPLGWTTGTLLPSPLIPKEHNPLARG